MRPKIDQKYQELEAVIGKPLLDRLYRDIDEAVTLVKQDKQN
jgi:hypothetical protein